MLFFDRLQTETAAAREQLFSAPIIAKAMTGDAAEALETDQVLGLEQFLVASAV